MLVMVNIPLMGMVVIDAGNEGSRPTATPEPTKNATQITAELVAGRCERYRSTITRLSEDYHVDPDLVLAVMAQESHCMRTAVSDDRYQSAGLMQIVPRPWTPTLEELMDPNVNIEFGMWMLGSIIEQTDGDWVLALQYYNCGQARVQTNPQCGGIYATKILDFWLPYFRQE
jgi:soluble lytic murein transglycosylase